MQRRRWLFHIVFGALSFRKGRTLLLLAVLTMASSLATALGVVSASMEKRVAEETRKYGANLVIVPEAAHLAVGSGGLRFGEISESAYLSQSEVREALARSGLQADSSFHLRGALRFRDADLPVEGVDFRAIRRLFPWWRLKGAWTAAGEALVGSDLARQLRLQPGAVVELNGGKEPMPLRVTGVVTTGGDDDRTLFLPLPELQGYLQRPDQVTQVRLLVTAGGKSLKDRASSLQPLLRGAAVKEVRQVAGTSEELLNKVKLLMLLVTVVVLVCAGASITGTMSATVLERGKEIGLLKAMGGTRWDLLGMFSAEAVILGIAGGGAGYLFGTLIAQFVTRTVFSVSADVVPLFFPVALGVSLLLALAGSLGPLLSVFKLDPVRSLRGE